jgi:hypothetical protein
LTGTTKEQKDVEQVAHWVHDARLGNTQQQQQLLSCLDGTTHSLLPVLSETIAAGLKQLFVGDASSFVQQKPTAVHLLGLLCVALAACLEFVGRYVRASDVEARVKLVTLVASSGDWAQAAFG